MILFRNRRDKYGFLSNFCLSPFEAEGLIWPTVEHFFQAMKTEDRQIQAVLAGLPTPLEAKKMGRQVQLRGDWAQVKYKVMLEALRQKFRQNPDLAAKLLATGDEELHEDSPHDKIWGWRDNGQDLLGKCLMRVRGELRRGTGPAI
ncbi:MAG: NADAR family protein [Elusimicrobiota bacterium]|nr:NADAR family protein [Elusimicrobiota bacterium]